MTMYIFDNERMEIEVICYYNIMVIVVLKILEIMEIKTLVQLLLYPNIKYLSRLGTNHCWRIRMKCFCLPISSNYKVAMMPKLRQLAKIK